MTRIVLILVVIFIFLLQKDVFAENNESIQETVHCLEIEIQSLKKSCKGVKARELAEINKKHKREMEKIERDRIDKSANIWLGKINFNVPIGPIIPWIPNKYNPKDETDKKTDLPLNFAICNGPQLTDNPGTKFDERNIPKLRTEDVFKGVENSSMIFIIKVN